MTARGDGEGVSARTESRKEKKRKEKRKGKGKIKVRAMETGNPRAFNPDTRYIFRLKETYSNLIV